MYKIYAFKCWVYSGILIYFPNLEVVNKYIALHSRPCSDLPDGRGTNTSSAKVFD